MAQFYQMPDGTIFIVTEASVLTETPNGAIAVEDQTGHGAEIGNAIYGDGERVYLTGHKVTEYMDQPQLKLVPLEMIVLVLKHLHAIPQEAITNPQSKASLALVRGVLTAILDERRP